MGVPNMEDHRQFHLPCQIQLVNEPQMLLQSVLLLTLVVIVQTDFADGDHAGAYSHMHPAYAGQTTFQKWIW